MLVLESFPIHIQHNRAGACGCQRVARVSGLYLHRSDVSACAEHASLTIVMRAVSVEEYVALSVRLLRKHPQVLSSAASATLSVLNCSRSFSADAMSNLQSLFRFHDSYSARPHHAVDTTNRHQARRNCGRAGRRSSLTVWLHYFG